MMLGIRTFCVMLVVFFFLVGCAGTGYGQRTLASTGSNQRSGPVDFGWRLSGDRSVAPLQIFSDASHIWLQWFPNQTLPAIFGVSEQGEQLASYEREGPYTKLEKNWSALIFRGAHLQARARRVGTLPQVGKVDSPTNLQPSEVLSVAPPAKTTSASYAVTSADKNLRQTLGRWSAQSGWRFQAEHWAVDVDIPLTGHASFTDDFVSSVRALLESTEMSDRPLQPCFYTNQVLRIVPMTEACDRTVVVGAQP